MPLETPATPETGSESPTEAFLAESVTPSGIEIRYFVEPKRKYELRGDPEFYPEFAEWHEVPSVTDVLNVLEKPGLTWWGMRIGVRGLLSLMTKMDLAAYLRGADFEAACKHLEELLKINKLTVNDVRDKAGDRGQAVHDALEVWAGGGDVPSPHMFAPEDRGYVIGLCKFLNDVRPKPLASEVMVGSIEYGFAGRYDIRFKVPADCRVVKRHTKSGRDHYATLRAGIYLGDLKTSSDVYPKTHFRQLEAYECASLECGYGATVARGILRVTEDGFYEFVRSHADFWDFLAVLNVWKSDQAMKERKANA